LTWFDQGSKKGRSGTEIFESVSISPERLSDFADYMGFQVSTDKDGKFVSLPPNLDLKDSQVSQQFINYWMAESSYHSNSADTDHIKRVQTYKQMDVVMAEASIALDTYADESLGVGFVEQPIEISISDKTVEGQVLELLNQNEILKRARSHMRNLIKYGDNGHQINLPPARDDKSFMDINLEYMDPLKWSCVVPTGTKVVTGYKVASKKDKLTAADCSTGFKGLTIQPWEFIQMTVFDEDYRPYGKSLLEPMRVDFDHLLTMEALLALSRAARVERLVIKVPTGTQNPIQAASKLSTIKAQFKNTIFKDTSLGTKSYARTPALTDVLIVPSDAGFDIQRLPSSIDLSSPEDVQYFRDRAFTVTGLPKSYFLHDETQTRGSALQQQDIMFARKLIQFQNAFVDGLTKMCMVLSVYVTGADISNIQVEVKLKRPAQLAATLIEYYATLIQTATQMIQSWMAISGQEQAPPGMFPNLLMSMGMPADIVKLFSGNSYTPDQMQNYLTSSMDITCTSAQIIRLEPFFEQRAIKALRERRAQESLKKAASK
jgi:hypothetical protein